MIPDNTGRIIDPPVFFALGGKRLERIIKTGIFF